MKADELFNWDKLELARILVEEYSDADDLLEAFPSIGEIETFEIDLFHEYLEQNWMLILPHFNVDYLLWWMNKKEREEKDLRRQMLILYREYRYIEQCEYYARMEMLSYIELFEWYDSLKKYVT